MQVKNYYNKLSKEYFNGSDELASYHNMRVSTALNLLEQCPVGEAFDFACGSGEFTKLLHDRGFAVSGCDLSDVMVDMSNELLGSDSIKVGGMEQLDDLQSFDLMVALNALPYLSEIEEEQFFKKSAQALKPGAYLLLSHTNMLFDMVTFNKYTVSFWEENLIKPFSVSESDREQLTERFRSMLTHADQPKNAESSWKGNIAMSEREVLPKRRVDPFAYPEYVEQFGFKVEKFAPINAFPLPPAILESDGSLIKRQHQFHGQLRNDTLLRLICSQFQMLCVRT